MRVLLISANTERTAILPLPLGPAFVAAACRRAGHETALLNLMFERDPLAALRKDIEEFRLGSNGDLVPEAVNVLGDSPREGCTGITCEPLNVVRMGSAFEQIG